MLKSFSTALMHLSAGNLLPYYITLFNSSVHGFGQTTGLVINEGATQEVIRMILDVKGNTLLEPSSTRVLNFDFSFTCIDSSNGGGPQAVGELWMYLGGATTDVLCDYKVAFKLASCSISTVRLLQMIVLDKFDRTVKISFNRSK